MDLGRGKDCGATRSGNRRRRSLGMLVALLLAIPIPSALAGQVDWARRGYDGGLTQHNALESTIDASNVARLRLDWMSRIRPHVDFIYEYTADPFLVADGRVFAAWSGSDAPTKVLAAFDETTGDRLWTVRSEVPLDPVAATATMLIANARSRPPSVRALDARTGDLLWSKPGAEPVVADRSVRHVFAVDRRVEGPKLMSLDASTGERRWTRRLLVRRSRPSVLLSRGLLVVPIATDAGPRVVAVREDDGTTVWSGRVRGDPEMVSGGMVLTGRSASHGADRVVEAFSLRGGPPEWSFRAPSTASLAAVGNGRVFVNRSKCLEDCEGDYAGTYRGGVIALDLRTGDVLWRGGGSEARGGVAWNAGVLANGLLFVERLRYGHPTFGALDAVTGRLLWRSTFGPSRVSGSVDIVANGAVFGGLRFGDHGGRIVRLALPPS